ncbi:AAA family ATPase [Flavobacterium sp. LMO9]|nr:AAA family ATPase [Flavobacterium sp. LMO9]MQP62923.1 AAA family ATPase [Flavobacterium sp. LMO6]
MDINKEIEILKKMKESNSFVNYIEHIRYPYFRNLEVNTMITFDFPITFFVGKNGGGKSSTLQSLYGAPKNYSLGEYWFTTEIDPIQEFADNRNCFIYGFKSNNIICEVLKQRINREKNPDYWEPSRPVKKYEMDSEKRYSPIEKSVEYIDFRSELSAFDKFMYFLNFSKNSQIKSKQDYLRKYSKKLKQAFNTNSIIKFRGVEKNKKVIKLTEAEIQKVSYILGKNYISIDILEHSFFKEWGFSVRFTSNEISYSEAFAGSGETAIIVLINKIFNCTENSLILLDEPETSLHSGAQIRLREFLIEQCKKKKLQIIISTHSPILIKGMPANSIKVFSLNKFGQFHIENERDYKEAFYELEIETDIQKKQIIVEDKLAKIILDKILNKLGKDTKEIFNIKYLPGGSDSLKQKITTIIEVHSDTIVIFDGDQKQENSHVDISTLAQNQIESYEQLNSIIEKQTKCKIKFSVDGNNEGGNSSQKKILAINYLNFYLKNVFYFPLKIPEDIIWDNEFALNKLNDLSNEDGEKVLADINDQSKDSKEKFLKLSLVIYNSTEQIESLYIDFIMYWLKKEDENYIYLKDLINKVKN